MSTIPCGKGQDPKKAYTYWFPPGGFAMVRRMPDSILSPLATSVVTIDRLSYGPAGVGRLDGKVVFVPETAPGDVVEIAIEEEKKGYARGRVVQLLAPSPARRTPPCPHVHHCGGCPWQHLTYEEQLHSKEVLVREQLRRIGGLSEVPLSPILPSPQEWQYRHRIRLHVEWDEGRARVGFAEPRSHTVVEVRECWIAWPGIAEHLQLAREWVTALRTRVVQVELAISETEPRVDLDHCTKAGDERVAPGVVMSGSTRQPLELLSVADVRVCEQFLATHPECAGLRLSGPGWRRAWGNTSRAFFSEGEALAANDGTFTQVNPVANRVLTAALLRLCAIEEGQRVVELYCGAGNFSLALARRARELIGIEHSAVAITAARENAARAGVTNARFIQASALAGVQRLLKSRAHYDILVLDPPRVGASEVIDLLPQFGASMIAYVSCDPATLARDLRRLQAHGYRLQTVQPVDMFPQTYHVESIAISVLT